MIGSRKTPEFPDPKPTVDLVAAERQLLAHLGEAMKLISQGGLKSREGIMEGIEAVICFLQDRGVSGQQMWPFGLLRRELDSIFEGKRSPILQPGIETRADISSNRYTGPDKEDIRVFASACSEATYQLGRLDPPDFPKCNRIEADKLVARAMTKWRTFDQKHETARTIKGWRDKLVKAKDPKFVLLVDQFTRDNVGHQHLKEVLKKGPPHTGGF
ncbi:hypothetical protein ABUE31_03395 [Mesorhizobium sp. ZMM04-5]|uniref:Uncharacterized protein n=1 Tax=Mesorhizobium marinum TaxID=3228790 RepID=A0ABV3QXF1_9HYPH